EAVLHHDSDHHAKTVEAKNTFKPIRYAKPSVYLPTTPINNAPTAPAIAVAVKTAPASIPVIPAGSSSTPSRDKVDGLTNKIYAIARKVVIPAMNSVR